MADTTMLFTAAIVDYPPQRNVSEEPRNSYVSVDGNHRLTWVTIIELWNP